MDNIYHCNVKLRFKSPTKYHFITDEKFEYLSYDLYESLSNALCENDFEFYGCSIEFREKEI